MWQNIMAISGFADIWLKLLTAFGINDYDIASGSSTYEDGRKCAGGDAFANAYAVAREKLMKRGGHPPSMEHRNYIFSNTITRTAFDIAHGNVHFIEGTDDVLTLFRLGDITLYSTDAHGLALFNQENPKFYDRIKKYAEKCTSDVTLSAETESFNMTNIFAHWTRNKELAEQLVRKILEMPKNLIPCDGSKLKIPALKDLGENIVYFSYKAVDSDYYITSVLEQEDVIKYVESLDSDRSVELITNNRSRNLPANTDLAGITSPLELADSIETVMLLAATGLVGITIKPSVVFGATMDEYTVQEGIMAIVGEMTIQQWLNVAENFFDEKGR
jgi:hypothetical protein